jgi:hypothetical protein
MFASLKPVNSDAKFPKFLIAGAEWSGYVWASSGTLDEINHKRSDGFALSLRTRNEKSVWLNIVKELAPGVVAEKGDIFESIEAAAGAGLKADFETVDAAGATWFQCRDRDGFAEWVCAFGPHDAGKVTRFSQPGGSSHFHAERRIEVNGRAFKVEHYGYSAHLDGDTEIKTFNEAASACASLFDLLFVARGGDNFENAFKAGREALKREISSL